MVMTDQIDYTSNWNDSLLLVQSAKARGCMHVADVVGVARFNTLPFEL